MFETYLLYASKVLYARIYGAIIIAQNQNNNNTCSYYYKHSVKCKWKQSSCAMFHVHIIFVMRAHTIQFRIEEKPKTTQYNQIHVKWQGLKLNQTDLPTQTTGVNKMWKIAGLLRNAVYHFLRFRFLNASTSVANGTQPDCSCELRYIIHI